MMNYNDMSWMNGMMSPNGLQLGPQGNLMSNPYIGQGMNFDSAPIPVYIPGSTDRKTNTAEVHFEIWQEKTRLDPTNWVKQ